MYKLALIGHVKQEIHNVSSHLKSGILRQFIEISCIKTE
jgi:hypothetical protein